MSIFSTVSEFWQRATAILRTNPNSEQLQLQRELLRNGILPGNVKDNSALFNGKLLPEERLNELLAVYREAPRIALPKAFDMPADLIERRIAENTIRQQTALMAEGFFPQDRTEIMAAIAGHPLAPLTLEDMYVRRTEWVDATNAENIERAREASERAAREAAAAADARAVTEDRLAMERSRLAAAAEQRRAEEEAALQRREDELKREREAALVAQRHGDLDAAFAELSPPETLENAAAGLQKPGDAASPPIAQPVEATAQNRDVEKELLGTELSSPREIYAYTEEGLRNTVAKLADSFQGQSELARETIPAFIASAMVREYNLFDGGARWRETVQQKLSLAGKIAFPAVLFGIELGIGCLGAEKFMGLFTENPVTHNLGTVAFGSLASLGGLMYARAKHINPQGRALGPGLFVGASLCIGALGIGNSPALQAGAAFVATAFAPSLAAPAADAQHDMQTANASLRAAHAQLEADKEVLARNQASLDALLQRTVAPGAPLATGPASGPIKNRLEAQAAIAGSRVTAAAALKAEQARLAEERARFTAQSAQAQKLVDRSEAVVAADQANVAAWSKKFSGAQADLGDATQTLNGYGAQLAGLFFALINGAVFWGFGIAARDAAQSLNERQKKQALKMAATQELTTLSRVSGRETRAMQLLGVAAQTLAGSKQPLSLIAGDVAAIAAKIADTVGDSLELPTRAQEAATRRERQPLLLLPAPGAG